MSEIYQTIEIKQKNQLVCELIYSEKQDHIYIASVWVDVNERNKGIGSNAINKLIDYAKKLNKDVVIIPTNTRNTNLYKRLGFVKEGKTFVYKCK